MLSIIPPFPIAIFTCSIFSKFPVNIPAVLFPKFTAESIAVSIPVFNPLFNKEFFISITWFSIRSGNIALNPISIA